MTTRRTFMQLAAATIAAGPPISMTQAALSKAGSGARASMRTYTVPHTDLVVSRVGYGSGYLGGTWDRKPVTPETISDASRLIHTAYDNGITFFDLADIYCFGKSEEAFGEVLKQSPGLRQQIVIQSKCGIRWDDDPRAGDPRRIDYSREHIVSSVEGSLRRLRTDRLEILLLHQPDPLMQPDEIAEAFDALKQSGKVRYFGVSNHSARQIELLQKAVRPRLVANQVSLGLANPALISDAKETTVGLITPSPEELSSHAAAGDGGTLEYCRLHDIQVQAYSPLRGLPLKALPEDASPQVQKLAQTLKDMATKKNVAPAAVGLAWLLAHPAGIVPIIEPRNPDHIIENCTADRVALTREEWYALWIAAIGLSH